LLQGIAKALVVRGTDTPVFSYAYFGMGRSVMDWTRFAVFSGGAAAAMVVLGACEFRHAEIGPMREEPVSIDLGNIERANVRLELGAGELRLRSGAGKLVRGRFEYNVPAWKPQVNYSANGASADLTIRQPHGTGGFGDTRNIWDLELSEKVLLDFTLNCGAGQGRLEMGDMDLQHVAVKIGAGQIDLDLRGKPTHDYDVEVSGGVGQATVRVPENVGVRAEAHGGIGHIDVSGLEKHGDYYENSLYGNSKVNVRLRVQGGIGEIRIIE
jgi:hypothetical protein